MDDRQGQILQALCSITREVGAKNSLETAMATLVERIRQTTLADCCSLYLCDELRQRYRLVATDGLAPSAVGKASLSYGQGLVGVVGATRELLDLADAPSHPNFKYLPDVGEDEYKSFLGVPVINQGELLGVLVIQSRQQRQFGQTEESFLVTLSAQIASIIAASQAEKKDSDMNLKRYKGAKGTGHLAIAKALVWQPSVSLDEVKLLHSDDPLMQQELFHQTIFQMQVQMDKAALEMQENDKGQAASGYIASYGKMLDDTALQDEVDARILEEGLFASSAIKKVLSAKMAMAKEDGDEELYQELKDFAQILVSRLVHASNRDFDFNEQVILVVESLPAAMLAELPREKIVGFVVTSFNTTSHATILARDLGIPSVFGVELDPQEVDGRVLVVNGCEAEVLLDPPQSVIDEFEQLINQDREQADLFYKERNLESVTLDGVPVAVQLNAGMNHDEAEHICDMVDGVGLYRTEIAFMLTQSFPSEAQQIEWYKEILGDYKGKSVCMRTLDVGSDKGLPYLPCQEVNPALGWRGIRVSMDQPQIMMAQLKAMLSANIEYGNLEIMIPMASRLDEVLFARDCIQKARSEIESATGVSVPDVRFGVMVEVPSLVYMLDDVAPYVDFFSIGSNDLVQYLLAVDRANTKVSRFYDDFHPAVVRCLSYLASRAKELDKPITVCGELASSPLGVMLLISLGFDRVSMNYSGISRIKYIIRRLCHSELIELGQKAVTLHDCTQIRNLYNKYAKDHGLSRILDVADGF